MSTNKILIIEDEAEIREGIITLLDDYEYVFIEAENGEKGLDMLTEEVDLVILDIMMPGLDGIEVCRQIRQRSYVPILFLTAKTLETDKLIGIKTGADDYLTKPFSYMELNARIKALLRRYNVYRGRKENSLTYETDYIDIDNIRISLSHNEVMMGEQEINLTETEYQILLMLMKKPNRSHSNKVIYEGIWNEQYYFGANRTVMVHIKNLRQKIEDDPKNPCHIVTVWGKGYQFQKRTY